MSKCPECGEEGKQKAIDTLCREWAQDHTHAQKIALKVGVPVALVEGDSYGVPGIIELLDMIAEKLLPDVTVERKP